MGARTDGSPEAARFPRGSTPPGDIAHTVDLRLLDRPRGAPPAAPSRASSGPRQAPPRPDGGDLVKPRARRDRAPAGRALLRPDPPRLLSGRRLPPRPSSGQGCAP